MATVTVRAALPLTWLSQGQIATVERTSLIDGAIRSGALEVLADSQAATLVEHPPVPTKVASPRARKRSRG